MSEIDAIKEDLGWLKFWAGSLMAALLAVVAWLFNNATVAENWQKALVATSVVLLIYFIGAISYTVKKKIRYLKEL